MHMLRYSKAPSPQVWIATCRLCCHASKIFVTAGMLSRDGVSIVRAGSLRLSERGPLESPAVSKAVAILGANPVHGVETAAEFGGVVGIEGPKSESAVLAENWGPRVKLERLSQACTPIGSTRCGVVSGPSAGNCTGGVVVNPGVGRVFKVEGGSLLTHGLP